MSKLVRLPDGWVEKFLYFLKRSNVDVKITSIGGLIGALFICLFALVIAIAAISEFISVITAGQITLKTAAYLIGVLVLSLYLLFFAGGAYGAFCLTMADIVTFNEGVWVQTLGKWGIFIPWDSFRYSRIFKVRHITWALPYDPGANSYAVHVPGLTIFHRLLSFSYWHDGLRFQPIFIISPEHINYKKLIELIEERQQ